MLGISRAGPVNNVFIIAPDYTLSRRGGLTLSASNVEYSNVRVYGESSNEQQHHGTTLRYAPDPPAHLNAVEYVVPRCPILA